MWLEALGALEASLSDGGSFLSAADFVVHAVVAETGEPASCEEAAVADGGTD